MASGFKKPETILLGVCVCVCVCVYVCVCVCVCVFRISLFRNVRNRLHLYTSCILCLNPLQMKIQIVVIYTYFQVSLSLAQDQK